ncbi:hypothetical protein AALO_G00104810 [Alosa alosa]|uniref:Septin 9 n=1 Tax=Alosa alosa TaxID=278164 RepID=A0AAV6GX13_9TELE|nr:hypothetical protein AALO_G00104810 [Alosa alosa]
MEGDKIAALKRSFEVEDVDATSPTTRRNANSHQRAGISPSSQSYYDLGSRANHANSPRPKARTPEPVSRRSELSIDISSNHKSVDSSPSQGVSRFALKRPEVLGHSKTPELAQKHTVTFSKPLETTLASAHPPRPPAAPPRQRQAARDHLQEDGAAQPGGGGRHTSAGDQRHQSARHQGPGEPPPPSPPPPDHQHALRLPQPHRTQVAAGQP